MKSRMIFILKGSCVRPLSIRKWWITSKSVRLAEFQKDVKSVSSQVVYNTRAYPGFCSIKQLGVSLIHCSVTLSSKFPGAHLYNWVERGTMRVPKNPTQYPQLWLEPGQFDPESGTLSIMPLRLPHGVKY